MAAEYTMRVHGLCTKLSGRRGKRLRVRHYSCHKRHTRVLAEKSVTLLPGHQVGRALQSQVRHAALVLVTAIPERQLAKDQRIFRKEKLKIHPLM